MSIKKKKINYKPPPYPESVKMWFNVIQAQLVERVISFILLMVRAYAI